MSLRPWFLAAIQFCTFYLFGQAPVSGRSDPTTADEVLVRYWQAIGADRFPSVTTLVERGEVNGNLFGPRDQAHGTYESYYKTPNLRFSFTLTDKRQVIAVHGCDGKVAWFIDRTLKRTESKPKPGNESACRDGFKPGLSHLREPNVKMRLVGKKRLGDDMAWEVKADVPKSTGTETYYFDAETFLLSRSEKNGVVATYSDYRDAGGMKFPFKTVTEFESSRNILSIRELEINVPIDSARFAELEVKNGTVFLDVVPSGGDKKAAVSQETSPPPNVSAPQPVTPQVNDPLPASLVELNFPNYTSCPVAELLVTVPELKGLKPATDQQELSSLLDKIGAKTREIAKNTPNLISHETVSSSKQGSPETRDYDYLILSHTEGAEVNLDEFRVDRKSGEKFQTGELLKENSSVGDNLERASRELAASESGRAPMTQGFAAAWTYFYPADQQRSSFRYLGEQKMDGRHTLVLAFAQKPASVVFPGIVRYQGRSVPMYMQGVAWVDPSDYRILRLRTDLLEPLPENSLHQLTSDIQLGLTRIEDLPRPLILPREVTVTYTVGGSTGREIHKYSEYRLFRVQSRLVLNP